MESEFNLLREENARLMTKITGLEFEKAELKKRVMKLKEKQLENVIIKNIIYVTSIVKNMIISIKQYLSMDIFPGNHYLMYRIWGCIC